MSTNPIKQWFEALPPEKKRKVVVGGGLGLVMVGVFIAVLATDNSSQTPHQSSRKTKVEASLLTGKDPQKVGIEQMAAANKRQEALIENLQRQIQVIANNQANKPGSGPAGAPGLPYGALSGSAGQEVVALPGSTPNDPAATPGSPAIQPSKAPDRAVQQALSADPNSPLSTQGRPAQPRTASNALPPPNIAGVTQDNSDVFGGAQSPQSSMADAPPPPPPKLKLRLLTPRQDTPSSDAPANTQSSVTPSSQSARSLATLARGSSQREPEFYLPMGSMMSGTLMTGVDAPASGSAAKKDPFPALFRVKQEAILPNSGLLDLRECFIIASAFGDLSSERVYMRAEGLSCQRSDGAILEATIDAYASGGDGKAGIRGTVVEKTGQLIGRSLLAGFVSGIGKSASPKQAQPVAVNPVPGQPIAFQYPSADFVVGSAVLGGASSAAERIASIYEDLARQIVPVIEVHAGIPVDFIMTRGATLRFRRSGEQAPGARPNQPQQQAQQRQGQFQTDGPVTTSVSGSLGGPFSVTPGPGTSTPPRPQGGSTQQFTSGGR